jgi:hypothetical protein
MTVASVRMVFQTVTYGMVRFECILLQRHALGNVVAHDTGSIVNATTSGQEFVIPASAVSGPEAAVVCNRVTGYSRSAVLDPRHEGTKLVITAYDDRYFPLRQ